MLVDYKLDFKRTFSDFLFGRDKQKMIRIWSTIFAYSFAVICMVSLCQSHSAAAQVDCGAPIEFPILDAASGNFYSGHFKNCQSGIEDQTTGANELAPGQQLFFVPGRTLSGSWKVGALVRAFPNRAYPIHPSDPRVKDGAMVWWAAEPQTSWEGVPVLLPFVPTTAGVVGQYDPGEDIYGYTNLIPLPGFEGAMAPLNSKSVIIGVSGVSFANANGLQALLSGFSANTSWIEILYVQQNEPRIQIRRAFIKLVPRASAVENWTRLARQNPLSRPRDRNTLAEFALVGLALAAMAAGQAMAHDDRVCQWIFVQGQDDHSRFIQKCE